MVANRRRNLGARLAREADRENARAEKAAFHAKVVRLARAAVVRLVNATVAADSSGRCGLRLVSAARVHEEVERLRWRAQEPLVSLRTLARVIEREELCGFLSEGDLPKGQRSYP